MTSRGTINNKNDFRAGAFPNGTLVPASTNNQSAYTTISKVKLITDGVATLTNGDLTGLSSLEVDTITVNNVVIDHITFPNLTANTALILNASKELTSSVTTDTELSYVHGVTSSIQTQLDSKLGTANILGTTDQISCVPSGNDVTISIANNPIFPGTGGMTWPTGTTVERSGIAGTTRFNSQTMTFEGTVDGSTWATFTSSTTSITSVTASPPLASSGGNNPDISLTGVVSEIHGGTNQSSYTLGDTIYASATDTLSKLSGNTTISKQYLSQTGDGVNSAAPSWSIVNGGDITGAALTKVDDTNITLTLGGSPSTALLRATSITAGWSGTLSPARGGTGVNNGTNTLTLAGNLATSGAFASTFTMTNTTAVTFPTSGTLATTAGTIPSIGTSTDTALVRWNGTGGNAVSNSTATLDGSGNLTVNGTTTSVGQLKATAGTASTSTGTGSLVVTGGIGLTGAINMGGNISVGGSMSLTFTPQVQGRLTLTSGTAVTTNDVTAASTIYFTPYKGNLISLYNGSVWVLNSFTEVSLSLTGFTNGNCYDIFIYNNAGTITLTSVAWTSNILRATNLTLQNGVYVLSGDTTKLYLGTIYMSATSQTQDAYNGRYVWNYYNRISKGMKYISNSNWTYSSSTIRQANASTSYQLNFVVGVLEDTIRAKISTVVYDPASGQSQYTLGFGTNSTTAYATNALPAVSCIPGTGFLLDTACAFYDDFPVRIGYNFLAWLESTNATGTSNIAFTANGNGLLGSIFC